MISSLTKTPEQLLDELGITEPSQIKIEAIAYHCQAIILYEPLSGCEANIVGRGDRAIITVDSSALRTRQRFSAGHELGHWMKDRGQVAFGCGREQMDSHWIANNPETRANQFASDLLLPSKLFVPLAKGRPITVETVRDLGRVFEMSLTATAIKLVRFGSFPSMVLYFEDGERKWFIPSGQDLPRLLLWPVKQLDPSTVSARLSSGGIEREGMDDVRTDKWFDVQNANRYYVRESCFATGPGSVVTLLWWEDEKQIIDLQEEEEQNASRRSDWRRED
ncbi:MAG: ImmA/IrrE family metallo-endopeptidase [Acidobacteria bacterium]|nr:ImmA/IrrE family metallo-endopeptidase [Acidobacteriota bacterium]MBS1867931.1 ImmA/IrrE family metallo-endopeptidase [Acidobacteriota bacterium]